MNNQPQSFDLAFKNLGQYKHEQRDHYFLDSYFVRLESVDLNSRAKLEDRTTIGGYFVLHQSKRKDGSTEVSMHQVEFGSDDYYRVWALVEQFTADHEDDPRKCYPTYVKETV